VKKPCSSLPRKILISGYHYETLFLLFEISFLAFIWWMIELMVPKLVVLAQSLYQLEVNIIQKQIENTYCLFMSFPQEFF